MRKVSVRSAYSISEATTSLRRVWSWSRSDSGSAGGSLRRWTVGRGLALDVRIRTYWIIICEKTPGEASMEESERDGSRNEGSFRGIWEIDREGNRGKR